jgi:uncharacterized protein YigE (DUF2233 family)
MIAIVWRRFDSPPVGDGSGAQRCFRVDQGPTRATVCRVNLSTDRLQLFLEDEHEQGFGGFAAIDAWLAQRGRKLAFAMNAGMFNPDYLPTGLFVADSGRSWPLNIADGEGNFFLKPNGVLVVSNAEARIVATSEYAALGAPVTLATQSGPLLVRAGAIHPAFRPDSSSRLIRNGVGVPAPGVALFAISDAPVNFYEFASLFRDTLHCPDALYLDGTVSSLHAPELDRSDHQVKLGPIIGVTIEAAQARTP